MHFMLDSSWACMLLMIDLSVCLSVCLMRCKYCQLIHIANLLRRTDLYTIRIRLHVSHLAAIWLSAPAHMSHGTCTAPADHLAAELHLLVMELQLVPTVDQEGYECMQGLTSSQKPMPMALCQIVAHEVKLEIIRKKHQVRSQLGLVLSDYTC